MGTGLKFGDFIWESEGGRGCSGAVKIRRGCSRAGAVSDLGIWPGSSAFKYAFTKSCTSPIACLGPVSAGVPGKLRPRAGKVVPPRTFTAEPATGGYFVPGDSLREAPVCPTDANDMVAPVNNALLGSDLCRLGSPLGRSTRGRGRVSTNGLRGGLASTETFPSISLFNAARSVPPATGRRDKFCTIIFSVSNSDFSVSTSANTAASRSAEGKALFFKRSRDFSTVTSMIPVLPVTRDVSSRMVDTVLEMAWTSRCWRAFKSATSCWSLVICVASCCMVSATLAAFSSCLLSIPSTVRDTRCTAASAAVASLWLRSSPARSVAFTSRTMASRSWVLLVMVVFRLEMLASSWDISSCIARSRAISPAPTTSGPAARGAFCVSAPALLSATRSSSFIPRTWAISPGSSLSAAPALAWAGSRESWYRRSFPASCRRLMALLWSWALSVTSCS
mmetsp:Transcript_20916/g.53180  ORF Transcript_20916/g.53180 Transcript_20916/m.53180 type:complete len:449 (+) Transcript_20916:330-1676(+)